MKQTYTHENVYMHFNFGHQYAHQNHIHETYIHTYIRVPAVLFWSSVWLIKTSSTETLLPRLLALARPQIGADLQLGGGGGGSGIEALDVRFVYGDKRRSDSGGRRRESSEALLEVRRYMGGWVGGWVGDWSDFGGRQRGLVGLRACDDLSAALSF